MSYLASVDAVTHPVFIVRVDRSRRALRVFGELDACSAPELIQASHELDPWVSVTICLESVEFIDAAGLGALVTLRERQRAAGGTLTVINAPSRIARVFALGGLGDMCPAFRWDRPDAAAAIRAEPRHRRPADRSAPITDGPTLRSA
jgi:anti-anti-sigma factor